MIYNNIIELIGKTPLIKLNKIAAKNNVYAKIESFNPGGSIKDRIALNMIEEAEMDGSLKKGTTIIEPTSGNTGIGLALVAAVKDYDLILTMPESMSEERRKLLKSYGAKLILTDADKGMKGAIDKANELVNNNPDFFMPAQFENPANPTAHKKTTAQELLSELEKIDALVVGVGTGGTLSGTGEELKNKFSNLKIYAVEPEDSPVLSRGNSGPHKIQGIGAGFVPEVLNKDLIDDVITVSNEEAFSMAGKLAQVEGLFAGISSGANVAATLKIVDDLDVDDNIVTFLPDTGERYLSVF